MSYDSVEQSTAGAKPFELYRFQTGDQSYFWTSSDLPVTYLGQVYTPVTIDRDELEHTGEVISGQLKIYVPPSNPIAKLCIPYLPPTPIAITVYGGHFGDSEVGVLFSGTVASAAIGDQVEILSNSDVYSLQKHIPKQKYGSLCTHIFGDPGCTVNIEALKVIASIDAIDSTGAVWTVGGFSALPHSLKGGFVKRGNDVRMVVDHTGANITLLSPMSSAHAGDSVTGYPGCQLTYAACQGYNNVAHFLGFDMMPEINPFDGSVS